MEEYAKQHLISQMKRSLRISTDTLNDEIMYNIDACMDDLARLGIKKPEPEGGNGGVRLYGGLPVKAIEIYLKWQYDFMGKGEQYRRNYEALCTALSMSEGYYE